MQMHLSCLFVPGKHDSRRGDEYWLTLYSLPTDILQLSDPRILRYLVSFGASFGVEVANLERLYLGTLHILRDYGAQLLGTLP